MDANGPFAAIKQCEEMLRKFAAEAAAQGEYDMLARLGTTARAISEIAREWQVTSSGRSNSDDGVEVPVGAPRRPASGTGNVRGRGRGAGSRGYPRFFRRGDDLVKIGWSKSDRREYQHRAPHNVLVALLQALLDASKRRKLFTMEALERQEGVNGAPGYQAYVWLAWLRSAGLVKQHGRQGYSLVDPKSFGADVESQFKLLPETTESL